MNWFAFWLFLTLVGGMVVIAMACTWLEGRGVPRGLIFTGLCLTFAIACGLLVP